MTEPTTQDIVKFAKQIGINVPPIYHDFPDWASVLHEVAHWAVKPDSYLAAFLENIQQDAWTYSGDIPEPDAVFFWNRSPEVIWLGGQRRWVAPTTPACYDPTPNEWGARAWGLQVLDLMGWKNPNECESQYVGGSAQFDWNQLNSRDSHPVADYGPDQLPLMGIDVSDGVLRPQVDVTFDGQMIQVKRDGEIIWERDVLCGGRIVGWSESVQYVPGSIFASLNHAI